MDVYDSEPYFGMLPKKWVRAFGYAALAALLVSPSARQWMVDQAEHHVLHEVRPMIDGLVEQVEPHDETPPTGPHRRFPTDAQD